MKISKLLLIITLMGLISIAGLQADDREIFSGSTKPYIMFILDNSGSMGDDDFFVCYSDAAKLANFQSYTTTTGKTYTYETIEEVGGGYWQWVRKWVYVRGRWRLRWVQEWVPGQPTGNYYATRIVALRRAATELLDSIREKVQIGAAHFFFEGSGSDKSHGARVFSPVQDLASGDAARDAAFDALTDYINNNVSADHYTPLAESMDSIYGYFSGDISATDGNQWSDIYGNPRIPAGSTTPVQYYCQRTYCVLVTDGSPTADDANYGYPNPYTGLGMDNGDDCLPNVAKYMYENPVPPATDGIVTYTVGMKMAGDGQELLEKTSDMNHGHGEHFPGDDYDQLIENLTTVIASIEQRNYAFTGYTSPKKLVSTGDMEIPVSFSGYFFSNSNNVSIWQGHLKCMVFMDSHDTYSFYEVWDAASKMYTQGESARNITAMVTGTNNHTLEAIDFSVGNKNLFINPMNLEDEAVPADSSEEVIKFIRADPSSDRPKNKDGELIVLADIFHSDVTFVGKPLRWKSLYNPSACDRTDVDNCPDCYQYFYEMFKTRQATVHVGTNDGVIHTIQADYEAATGGTEIAGFIPDEVLPTLPTIALDEIFSYTADGRMTANDIYTGGTDYWRTVLVFGLREGGRAYYCRDVTYPHYQTTKWKFPNYEASGTISAVNGSVYTLTNASGVFSSGQFIRNEQQNATAKVSSVSGFDITLTGVTGTFDIGDKMLALPWYYDYIGESWGKPVICRIKYKKAGSEIDKWVAILTGGMGDGTNNEGKSLFILDAWTGELIWWLGYTSGSDDITADHYIKNSAQLNYPIVQSLTAIDRDNNTITDTIYFGNIGGNLYKIDISDPQTSTWIPQILLKQDDTSQPLYSSPALSYDSCYDLWIHFGSGNRHHPQDGPTGKFFAIKDDGSTPSAGCVLDTDLQALTWSVGTLAETTINSAHGWYFNFPDSNEMLFDPDPMVVSDPDTTYLFLNTYQPSTVVVGGDPCGSGGNMKFYTINLGVCGNKISGENEAGRIAGGGMLDGQYILYIGTGQTGSISIKKFEELQNPFPGNIIFWKEIKR